MSAQQVLLVVGSGGRLYREYLLAGAAGEHRLWLLDSTEPTWQRRYVSGHSVVPLLDDARIIPNQEGLLKAAYQVAERRPVVGVFTYDETLVVTTAHIAERLGVPGLTVDGAENCRNKHRTRQVLTAAGLRQPRFALVHTASEATSAAGEIGYPVVAKPRGMGASIGVVRADRPTDLVKAFEVAHRASYGGNPAYEGGVLLEEMLVGTEISVDGMIQDGSYQPLFLARKQVGPPPYFEEVGHVVDPEDDLLADAGLRDVLDRAHHALGLQTGITHTEVMLTGCEPAVIEVNARLGGDLIPYLGQLATGIDPGRLAASLACEGSPPLAPTHRRVVGVRFAYPARDCRVRDVWLPAPGAMPGLLEAASLVATGTELRLPPKGYISRFAYVICTGADRVQCAARLAATAEEARLEANEPGEDPAGLLG